MKICEIFEGELAFLEATDKKLYLGTLRIPLAAADVKNKNGRTYSSELLQREMSRMNEKAKTGPVAGMLSHQPDGLAKLDKISHVFTSFEFDEKEKLAFGVAKILNTSKGQDLEILLDAVPLGASTVGRGTISQGGDVMDDYEMVSADIVSNPSSGIHISGKNLMESLNTVVEKDPQVNSFLIKERIAAGAGVEKKDENKVPEGMSAAELRLAGGLRKEEE